MTDRYDAGEGEIMLGDNLSNLRGVFSYPMSCTGNVTSIRARGFCPYPANSTVVMQIFNSTFEDGRIGFNDTKFEVECNTSAAAVDGYHEGYVSADNLSITVTSGGYLSVRFDPKCSNEGCFFRPAIVNETSKTDLIFFSDELKRLDVGVSLAFSATIEADGNHSNVYLLV